MVNLQVNLRKTRARRGAGSIDSSLLPITISIAQKPKASQTFLHARQRLEGLTCLLNQSLCSWENLRQALFGTTMTGIAFVAIDKTLVINWPICSPQYSPCKEQPVHKLSYKVRYPRFVSTSRSGDSYPFQVRNRLFRYRLVRSVRIVLYMYMWTEEVYAHVTCLLGLNAVRLSITDRQADLKDHTDGFLIFFIHNKPSYCIPFACHSSLSASPSPSSQPAKTSWTSLDMLSQLCRRPSQQTRSSTQWLQ